MRTRITCLILLVAAVIAPPVVAQAAWPKPPSAPTSRATTPPAGCTTYNVSTWAELVAAVSAINAGPGYAVVNILGEIQATETIRFTNKDHIYFQGSSSGRILARFSTSTPNRLKASSEFVLAFLNSRNVYVNRLEIAMDDTGGYASGIVFHDCIGAGVYDSRITGTGASRMISGIVATSLCRNLDVLGNTITGGENGVGANGSAWDSYRSFGMFLTGWNIAVANNTVTHFKLGGIKATAAYAGDPASDLYHVAGQHPGVLGPSNEAEGEFMADSITIQGNTLQFNKDDIGCTGIGRGLYIYDNRCLSTYYPERSDFPQAVSVHLKSGYRSPPPGSTDDLTRIPNGRIWLARVQWNDCRANLTIRSTETVLADLLANNSRMIADVYCRFNSITTGSDDANDQSQGITVLGAWGGSRTAESQITIRIEDNTITDTHSYAIALSGATKAVVKNNAITTRATPNLARHNAHLLISTAPTDGYWGWCHWVYFVNNTFSTDLFNWAIPELGVQNNPALTVDAPTDRLHFPILHGGNSPAFVVQQSADGILDLRPSSTPVVTVTATDALAAEYTSPGGSADTGTFTVTRTGSSSLGVQFTIAGTAQEGTDFAPIGTSLTIPSAQGSGTAILTATPDSMAEGAETVTLRLAKSAQYLVGTEAEATVTIADKPFDAWRTARFGAQANTEAVSGANADPDSDGLTNLMEYGIATDPWIFTPPADRPTLSFEEGELSLTYRREASAPDIEYKVQKSASLAEGTWSRVDVDTFAYDGIPLGTHTRVAISGGRETWRGSIPVANNRSVFLRLKILPLQETPNP